MLDTVKLTLDKRMFVITDVSLFQKETMNSTRGYFKLVQNQPKKELASGIYKPRLTLTKRFNCSRRFESTLSIELSLPKLVYKNNFDELSDEHFQEIIDKLSEALKTMGVKVFKRLLETAPISSIHYSKNIPLIDGSTPHYLIGKIKEANIGLALDVNQTDYRNDGHSFKWHSNTYEVIFYDKIHDLKKSKVSDKRTIENDNALQLHLFENLKNRKQLEFLRMEVRLNNRQKIRKLFQNLGIDTELTFETLFGANISQKVLLYYLSEIERQRPPILDYQASSPKALLVDLIVNNKSLSPKQTLQIYGLKQALDITNPRELKIMFGQSKSRSLHRLISDAQKIQMPKQTSPLVIVRNHLNSFMPTRLSNFPELNIH